jgi:4a-hydroxytetrahydrobiopterin dehydratase
VSRTNARSRSWSSKGGRLAGGKARPVGMIGLRSEMATELVNKSCVPCRGGVPPLEASVAKELLAEAPAWELADAAHRIERTFRFPNFQKAMDFVVKIGALAEAEGHHPDIKFGWGYATVSLHTHKIKGLHENDFIMAAKINRLAEGMPGH